MSGSNTSFKDKLWKALPWIAGLEVLGAAAFFLTQKQQAVPVQKEAQTPAAVSPSESPSPKPDTSNLQPVIPLQPFDFSRDSLIPSDSFRSLEGSKPQLPVGLDGDFWRNGIKDLKQDTPPVRGR